jgi:voltage-gated potassium channel Kch
MQGAGNTSFSERNGGRRTLREPYWRQLFSWVLEWPLVAALGAAALGLGYSGFAYYYAGLGETRSPFDLFYLSLQLFVLESGAVVSPVPWQLEVARLLAPTIAAYTAVKALAEIFHEELAMFRLRFRHNHVVVCGLGRKGLQLAKDFRKSGTAVVVIEIDEGNDEIGNCRALGVIVLIGNAADPGLLKKAGVLRARYLVAITGDDSANVEIAIHAYDLLNELHNQRLAKHIRKVFTTWFSKHCAALSCFVHIVDSTLCDLVREHPIFAGTAGSFEIQVVNSFENAARLLFRDQLLYWAPYERDDPRRMHLIICGFGQMGQSIALQAVRIGHFANGKNLRITVIDEEAEKRKKVFFHRYRPLPELCDVDFVTGDLEDPKIAREINERAHQPELISSVVLCVDDDYQNVSTALKFLPQLDNIEAPMHVRVTSATGLAVLLEKHRSGSDGPNRVRPFGMIDRICTREILLHEELDLLARAIHDCYRQMRRERSGEVVEESTPALKPWPRLDKAFKESNRSQAEHIQVKLNTVGCYARRQQSSRRVGALTSEVFRAEEVDLLVELLARMEHERWVAEKLLAGWTFGPENDLVAKTNPNLTTWENLPDEVQEYDRQFVRDIPLFLSKIGVNISSQKGSSFWEQLRNATDISDF